MNFSDIPVPEIYKESADFRFFLKWFANALTPIKYDTEHLSDLYDPMRCPSELLWMLGDTIGYKFDDRLPIAFNRLAIIYFMNMIANKGSKKGMMLAAAVNLAQFVINENGTIDSKDFDKLKSDALPVNAASVLFDAAKGRIDVTYLSTKQPIDACTEYVRPIGMYCFQSAGVSVDANARVSVDAKLTNLDDVRFSAGPTRVANYTKDSFSKLQPMRSQEEQAPDKYQKRDKWYYRNSEFEQSPNPYINPGYRTLANFQLANPGSTTSALLGHSVDLNELSESDVVVPESDLQYANKAQSRAAYSSQFESQSAPSMMSLGDMLL